MSKIRLHGSSSGYTEIAPVAASGNNTLTLPDDGTILSKDAAGAVGVTSIKSSNVNVGAAVTITESGIEASGIGITCANINGTQIGGRRNIIINGAFNVAQRGTSSSASSSEYLTLDRFRLTSNGTDEAPSQEQASVASGTSPYAEGFRKSFKITNGNQTSGAGAADFIRLGHAIEAQDIANSGWNYTSSSSFITCQFWIKSSVAQSFKVEFYSDDGTAQVYSIDTGSLSADTWTKVIKTIPGNSNLTFDNDANEGLHIRFLPFFGTDYTNNSVTEDAWAAYSSSTRTKDNTSTWYTTNDATFEITGLQLEVGSQATAFEHRGYGEELHLCQRYYVFYPSGYIGGGRGGSGGSILLYNYYLPTPLRGSPTLEPSSAWSSSNGIRAYKYNGQSDSTSTPTLGSGGYIANTTFVYIQMGGHSIDDDRVASFTHNNTLALNAEL